MAREPMVWAPVKIGILRVIERAGGNPDAALAAVGLSRANLQDPECYIPIRQSLAIPVAAADETGDEFFGLHWGQHDRPEHLGALAYVAKHSPTVRAALQNLVRYISIVTQGVDLWTTPNSLCYRVRDPSIPDLRHNNEYVVAFGLNLLRAVTSPNWRPRHVWFRHSKPERTDEYLEVLGVAPRFETSYNAIGFEPETLDEPNPNADPELLPILEQHADEILKRMPPLENVAASVREQIGRSLASGVPSLERIAELLSIGTRTLQRRLIDQGWSFRDIVEDTRRQMCLGFLSRSEMPMTEIAFLTGYSELSAFARAFRRWTGKTPVEFRRELRGG